MLLTALVVVVGYAAWTKLAILLLIGLVLMVLVVERMIHTTYTIDNTHLSIHTSRFRSDRVLFLNSIQRIERVEGYRIFGHALHTCLLLVYTDGDTIRALPLLPRDEDEFVKCIQKRRNTTHPS